MLQQENTLQLRSQILALKSEDYSVDEITELLNVERSLVEKVFTSSYSANSKEGRKKTLENYVKEHYGMDAETLAIDTLANVAARAENDSARVRAAQALQEWSSENSDAFSFEELAGAIMKSKEVASLGDASNHLEKILKINDIRKDVKPQELDEKAIDNEELALASGEF